MTEKKDGRANNGGARAGAGRKLSGKEPKKPIPAKVSAETRNRVKELSASLGVSQALVVEFAIANVDEDKIKTLKKD